MTDSYLNTEKSLVANATKEIYYEAKRKKFDAETKMHTPKIAALVNIKSFKNISCFSVLILVTHVLARVNKLFASLVLISTLNLIGTKII